MKTITRAVARAGIAFFAMAIAPAMAADIMPMKSPRVEAPAINWTGFFIGINGGWGWSNLDTTIDPAGIVSTIDFSRQVLNAKANGALFGGQLGYNWQLGTWVLGIEGDFDGAGISDTRQVSVASGVAPGNVDGFSSTGKITWLATVRGRIGYVWGPGLLYFTGGGAWEGLKRSASVSANTGIGAFGDTAIGTNTSTRSGFVVGGGYEWMVVQNWSVRGEYLFYDFHTTNTDLFKIPTCATASGCDASISTGRNSVSAIRFGVNYKF